MVVAGRHEVPREVVFVRTSQIDLAHPKWSHGSLRGLEVIVVVVVCSEQHEGLKFLEVLCSSVPARCILPIRSGTVVVFVEWR